MGITRAELRPENPADPEEKKLYLSGAELFQANEAAKKKKREQFPHPLRDLVAIREHPDDSDLKILSAAMQAIRNDPEPLLFQQLAHGADEGTLQIRSLLESILLNEHDFLPLLSWNPDKEQIAVDAVIEALPGAPEGVVGNLIEMLLRLNGGGQIEWEGPNGPKKIEVKFENDVHTSTTYRSSSQSGSMAEVQKELRRLYKKSRSTTAN